MAVAVRATTDLVACAWLAEVDGLSAAMVATTLPDIKTSSGTVAPWTSTGFVQVMGVGGSPAIHVPMRSPVVSVDCWAVKVDASGTVVGNKPPWGLANAIAEAIWAGSMDPALSRRQLTVLGLPVQVHSVYLMAEPRRIPSDSAGYARYQFDMRIHWTAI